jgi:hypothetical protein
MQSMENLKLTHAHTQIVKQTRVKMKHPTKTSTEKCSELQQQIEWRKSQVNFLWSRNLHIISAYTSPSNLRNESYTLK